MGFIDRNNYHRSMGPDEEMSGIGRNQLVTAHARRTLVGEHPLEGGSTGNDIDERVPLTANHP